MVGKKQQPTSTASNNGFLIPCSLIFGVIIFAGFLSAERPLGGTFMALIVIAGAISLVVKQDWQDSFFGLLGIDTASTRYLILGLTICFMLVTFSTTDLENANSLWEEGKKSEAVQFYVAELENSNSPDPIAFERVIGHYFENGDIQQATYFCNKAVEVEVEVLSHSKELRDFITMTQTEFRKKAEEAKVNELVKEKLEELNDVPVEGNTPEAETIEFRHAVVKAIGKKGLSFKINNYALDPKQKILQVRWEISDNLTDNLIRFSAMADIVQILQSANNSGINYFELTVFGEYPMVDKYGNSSKDVVAKATYRRTEVQKINWDNFLIENVYKVADDVWLHPGFRE